MVASGLAWAHWFSYTSRSPLIEQFDIWRAGMKHRSPMNGIGWGKKAEYIADHHLLFNFVCYFNGGVVRATSSNLLEDKRSMTHDYHAIWNFHILIDPSLFTLRFQLICPFRSHSFHTFRVHWCLTLQLVTILKFF